MKTVRLLFVAMTALVLAGQATADISLDVTPMRVQLHVMPGAEFTDAVEITNVGDEPVRIQAELEDWFLNEVGTPLYQNAGSLEATASFWVEIAPKDFLIEPGETEFVRFTTRIPEMVNDGGYHCAIVISNKPIITPDPASRTVSVRGRIATMIYVTVGHPKKSARIENMVAVPGPKGEPRVRLEIENDGRDFLRLAGDLRLYAGDKAVSASILLPDVPILPGTRRILELDLPRGVAPGMLARATIELDGIGLLVGECPAMVKTGILAK